MPPSLSSDHADLDIFWDAVVVGGGINGCGIARDLAGRGLKVLLCEKDDLAQHTSSRATKLIHGGLRYLEHYAFGLVRKALLEREVLMHSAPHITAPLRFVMPHDAAMRPAWMIRVGLFLYDHLARRRHLPGSECVDLGLHPAGESLKPRYRQGFVYSDAAVDDARLVVLNAMDAHERGATVLTRTRCHAAERGPDRWRLVLRGADGVDRSVHARALVNAAGPWAARFLADQAGQYSDRSLRLVKGSHIVVRRLYPHDHAYVFQSPDGRIIFTIPYQGDYTLIGTTDVDYTGALDDVHIDSSETQYLCEQVSRYFNQPVSPDQVVWSFAGVRPLLADAAGNPSGTTRDYQLELDRAGAPLLTVWGGKLTTYRTLSEDAGNRVRQALGRGDGPWTAGAVLPGGDLAQQVSATCAVPNRMQAYLHALRCCHPQMPSALLAAYARRYGTRTQELLNGVHAVSDLGAEIVPGLYEREAQHLIRHEWARTAEDILWRRTKLGLRLQAAGQAEAQAARLQAWLDVQQSIAERGRVPSTARSNVAA